jgi:hypothetical protein
MFHEHHVMHIFLRNDPSRDIVGEDEEFLTSGAIKQHFKDRYIKCNCTLCIWAVFWGPENMNNTCGKTS